MSLKQIKKILGRGETDLKYFVPKEKMYELFKA